MATKNADLVAEWNYQLNGNLHPDEIAYQSNKRVWWICNKCGYEWEASISNRNKGNGCPCCSNRVVVFGINDLLTKNKLLATDWNYDKNNDLSPDKIVPGSGKKIWWKCHICGYEWRATISSRNNGASCPKCSNEKRSMYFHKKAMDKKESILKTHPELEKEWNYERNEPLKPNEVSAGSRMQVWWTCCVCGYNWQSAVYSRTNGTGCPCCANKVVVSGINDLATLRPDLLEEWMFDKNDIQPYNVVIGSKKKVWWKCKTCGYEWLASIEKRTNGTKCPHCASRSQTSFPEQAVFFYVKKYYPDAENRYAEIFKNSGMELDVYIPSLKFAIEYDGLPWHNSSDSTRREQKKYSYCRDHGITLCRIKEQIHQDMFFIQKDVADYTITCKNHPTYKELDEVIIKLSVFLSIEMDIDTYRDNTLIQEQYYCEIGRNSLVNTHPELLPEWNHEKNGDLSPSMVSSGSQISVWWKCTNGHEWKVSPANRVFFKSKCPYCNNKKVLSGFNDLATLHPEVLDSWDYNKNGNLIPSSIMAGNSKKKVWWICKKGHHFEASPYTYLKRSGNKCPICTGKQVLEGYNDLATLFPNLILEWNYERNDTFPTEYTKGSNKKVWWKCSLNHEWQATISTRTNQGTGCPYCTNKKVLSGFNDLKTCFPVLINEWDFERNTESPSEITGNSGKKVWWKCSTCGYKWIATPADRTNGRGCPACAHLVVNPGVTDFETLFPERAKWWDYSKNADILPSSVGPYSEKKVWWKCDKGHEFFRAVKYSSRGYGCPICKKKH